MKEKNKKKLFLAASVAGLLAVTGAVALPGTALAKDGVECYGVNSCKGTGECGGKGYSCAGKNACKGQGWITAESAETCATQGGSLTPKE